MKITKETRIRMIPQQVKMTHGAEWGQPCDDYYISDEMRKFEKEQIDKLNAVSGNLKEYTCPLCNNKGYIIFQDPKSQTTMAKVCKCQKIRDSIKAAKKSGAWGLMQQYNFDTFKAETPWQQEMKQLAIKYCEQEKKGWFFAGGQTGAGKTHLCTAIFHNFFRSQIKGVYSMWRDEVRRLLNAGFAGAQKAEIRIDELKQCDVLYIDDLFKTDDIARPERKEIELAFEIVNSRYNTGKITIISSEKTLPEIATINQAIAGRIAEKCQKYIVKIEKKQEKNYRLREI